MPVSYSVDPARLEQHYRELQSQVHPDRFAAGTEAERRVAMQWATRANEAYRTLRDPVHRARYLLGLKGYDTGEETNTSMPPDFLMQQMEWRETVAGAREARDALGQIRHDARSATGCWRSRARGDPRGQLRCGLLAGPQLRFLEARGRNRWVLE
jgi:molecular chaperone HscB